MKLDKNGLNNRFVLGKINLLRENVVNWLKKLF